MEKSIKLAPIKGFQIGEYIVFSPNKKEKKRLDNKVNNSNTIFNEVIYFKLYLN